MIPDFKTYIGESIWRNISQRSEGIKSRKEDRFSDIVKKIEDKYHWIGDPENKKYLVSHEYDVISVQLFEVLNSWSTLVIRSDMKCVTFSVIDPDRDKYRKNDMKIAGPILHNLFNKLNDNFSVKTSQSDGLTKWIHFDITPADGKKTDVKFFFNVLDLILENIPEHQYVITKFIEKNDT